MGYETFPKSNPGSADKWARKQTSPGLATNATGQLTQTFPGKGGNGGWSGEPDTGPGLDSKGSGQITAPNTAKSGQMQTKPGSDGNEGRQVTDKGTCCDLRKMPKAQ